VSLELVATKSGHIFLYTLDATLEVVANPTGRFQLLIGALIVQDARTIRFRGIE